MRDPPWVVQEESVYKVRRKEGLGRVASASSWFQPCREVLPIQLEEVSIEKFQDFPCFELQEVHKHQGLGNVRNRIPPGK